MKVSMYNQKKNLRLRTPPEEDSKRAECHPEERHYAKGMCMRCYDAHRHRERFPKNKEVFRLRSQAWYKKNKERARLRDIAKKFGLPVEEYKAMVERQNNLCAICGKPPRFRSHLCVDHCHTRNQHRELLCITCNSGLGQFYDNPELLEKAAAYLRRHAAHV